MTTQQEHGTLQRGLKNRHIQLIALGGAVGTGLFLGSAGVMKMAGPAMILGYAIGGFIAFLIMRQLGEMIVQEPVSGSFSHFAFTYWGPFAGFLSGWNYWMLYVLVSMAELTAVGVYVQWWFPAIPTWVSVLAFFLLINAINLAHVKIYGEMEFWFAIIKIVAIIGMIVLGAWLLLSGSSDHAAVANLWSHGGFFATGGYGMFMALAIIMFSFGGLELVGITAAEAADPDRTIPKAINQVIWRILIFYIGALSVLLALYPWDQLVEIIGKGGGDYSNSPFVLIFSETGIPAAAHILNFVILTAALSVYNSSVYCNSRMLFGLAVQGNAPRALMRSDARGVPIMAILVSSVATIICVIINYTIPKQALGVLMSLVVAALVINWAMISLAHLRFRASEKQQGLKPKFPAIAYPFSNYLCIVFMGMILVILMLMPGTQPYQQLINGQFAEGCKALISSPAISVIIMPFWILLLWLGFKSKQR